MNPENIVVDLIAMNGGKLIGRTRLQKGAYLLHRCGANFDLGFVYHHYGPYSFDLVAGCLDARAEGWIEIEEKPGRYGVPYATFKILGGACPSDGLGELAAARARSLLDKMGSASDIVLEIAATIAYFMEGGRDMEGAINETKTRKPLKATPERLGKAVSLLRNLNLDTRNDLPHPA